MISDGWRLSRKWQEYVLKSAHFTQFEKIINESFPKDTVSVAYAKKKRLIQMTTLLKTETVKLKDWKPVTLILVIEDDAQKLPAAIAQYHTPIFCESMFLSEDISAWWFTFCNSVISVRGWGLNVSVVTAETGFD